MRLRFDAIALLLGIGASSASAGPVAFAPPQSYPVGIQLASMAIGDLNGDGHADVAVAAPELQMGPPLTHGIAVLLGDGTGQLGQPVLFTTSHAPFAVAIGNFNNDAWADLAVGDGSNVVILLGNGQNSLFDMQPPLALGPYGVQDIATGHFDADANLDLALALAGIPGHVGVLLGTGNGTFGPLTTYAVGAFPIALAVGDLDGDLKLDLAVANHWSPEAQSIAVLIGAGDGTFAAPTFLTAGLQPFDVRIADVDKDLTADLVVARAGGDALNVLRGTGGGAFAPVQGFFAPCSGSPNALSMAIDDFDGDSQLDVAVPVVCGQAFVFSGVGSGSFRGAELSPVLGLYAGAVGAGDLDEDGRPDLVVATHYDGMVHVLRNSGGAGQAGFFHKVEPEIPVGVAPWAIASADLNLDGLNDLVVANAGSASASVLLGAGGGSFTSAPDVAFLSPVNPRSVRIGRINFDCKPDLAIGSANFHKVLVRLGQGDGTFSGGTEWTLGPGLGVLSDGIVLADLSGDGVLDLAGTVGATTYVRFGDNIGGFPDETAYSSGGSTQKWMEAADLDADGDLELVMISDSGICILENLGSGSFAAAVCFAGQSPLPTALAIGDVNGDSAPDIVVTRGTLYTLYSYLNDGNLGFASFVTSPGSFTLQGDIGIALADLNLDGRLDVGVVNVATFNVRLGDGTGFFGPPASAAVSDNTTGLTIADLNQDWWPDAAVISSNSMVTVFLNGGADQDGDGIADAIDHDRVTNADESGFFSSDFNKDGTLGSIADRGGWTVTMDQMTLGSVHASLGGSGTSPAIIESCHAGSGPEQIWLDVVAERAEIACSVGTTTARALLALPAIELYEVIGGNLSLKASLQTGQQASAGSPLTASAQNQGQIEAALLDGQVEIGSFALDPGESVDVTAAVPGALAVTLLAGDVTFTVAGESVTLHAGSSHAFLLADPGTVLGNLPEAVTELRDAGEIRSPGAAFALRAKFEAAAWLVSRGRAAPAKLLLRGVLRDLDAFVRGRRMTAAARYALAPVVQALIGSL